MQDNADHMLEQMSEMEGHYLLPGTPEYDAMIRTHNQAVGNVDKIEKPPIDKMVKGNRTVKK